MNTKTITSWAATAKAIRKELKQKFPNTKFRVTFQGYAGGDSVNIGWTDGPTDKEVRDITDKYQQGSFDGMTDMYSFDNNRDDIPQTKYVFASRNYSEIIEERARNILSKIDPEWSDMDRFKQNNMLWKRLKHINFDKEPLNEEVIWKYINKY